MRAHEVDDRPAGGLGGVRREDRAVLEPLEHAGDEVAVDGALLERRPDPPDGRREGPLLDGGHLLPAVQLLGDVDELEVGRERPGQHDGRRRVEVGERRPQLLVVGLARQAAHPLDEGEQLGALVPLERLAEEGAELAHRGAQGGVLLLGGDAGGEGRDVRQPPVRLDELLGRRLALGGHATSGIASRFPERFPSHDRDTPHPVECPLPPRSRAGETGHSTGSAVECPLPPRTRAGGSGHSTGLGGCVHDRRRRSRRRHARAGRHPDR